MFPLEVTLNKNRSPSLAVQLVLATSRAVFHQLNPAWIVPTIFLSNIVALVAHRTLKGDMGANCLFRHNVNPKFEGRTQDEAFGDPQIQTLNLLQYLRNNAGADG
jgi:hypothetical protein